MNPPYERMFSLFQESLNKKDCLFFLDAKYFMEELFDIVVIGSGMAGLSCASLLANEGLKVTVIEQNWLPGGCTSSYPRKGFVFESGATTLVGLDEHMPLRHLLNETGIQLDARRLDTPMQVVLPDGRMATRHQSLEEWIAEAEEVFGENGQRGFWELCFKLSRFVWETSLKQKAFPPSKFSDLLQMAKSASFKQFLYARYAFLSTYQLLEKFGLHGNSTFCRFVDEQLLITAQNTCKEVNALFGATALCYTNFGNYYVDGGLINLVNPIVSFLEQHGGELKLRTKVEKVKANGKGYQVSLKPAGKPSFSVLAQKVVFAIPINNVLEVFDGRLLPTVHRKLMKSVELNSAFQMGVALREKPKTGCLHHQVHLPEPLPFLGSKSIFVSFSHPEDLSRSKNGVGSVASISTHFPDPENRFLENKEELERIILDYLDEIGHIKKGDIVFYHSSAPKSWEKWTGRKWGFVGGYPQYMHIKPWKMLDARLDGKGAYICGDSTYPGQGIPGATLSGIIAFEKFKRDHL